MIALADEVRGEVADGCLGRRLHTFIIRTRTWPGPRRGDGVPTDVDLTPVPTPKYTLPEPRHIMAEPGLYESGDILVRQVSAAYTQEQIGDFIDSPESALVEVFWVVEGAPYDVVSTEKLYTSWRVHLRTKRRT